MYKQELLFQNIIFSEFRKQKNDLTNFKKIAPPPPKKKTPPPKKFQTLICSQFKFCLKKKKKIDLKNLPTSP